VSILRHNDAPSGLCGCSATVSCSDVTQDHRPRGSAQSVLASPPFQHNQSSPLSRHIPRRAAHQLYRRQRYCGPRLRPHPAGSETCLVSTTHIDLHRPCEGPAGAAGTRPECSRLPQCLSHQSERVRASGGVSASRTGRNAARRRRVGISPSPGAPCRAARCAAHYLYCCRSPECTVPFWRPRLGVIHVFLLHAVSGWWSRVFQPDSSNHLKKSYLFPGYV
jgi:hypothetical protein